MSFVLDQYKKQYNFQSNYHRVGGARLHYLDEGEGTPVVLLHGNPSWSFMYRDLVRALRPSKRVIVPDHVGCGLSDKPRDDEYPYTLERRVADLESLLNELGIQSGTSLVVHDWGGVIGMAYAVRYPERISRLVILNTAAFHPPQGKSLHWTIRFCRKSAAAAMLIRSLNLFAVGASFIGCRENPLPRKLRRAYCAPYDSWQNRIATLRFIQDIPLNPRDSSYALLDSTQAGLSRLRHLPMMICWGEKDFVFDRNFLNEWIRRFPEADVRLFPKAGHYVVEDAGAEVVPAICEFLS